ncbi:DedA family protein [Celerinatantimonas yamalensis]|uniref:DedA family protein n=1 Tax=Celerinatantimonas yamalensis TaxID=559956 RepID=A0ABW9G8D7_9GAMM
MFSFVSPESVQHLIQNGGLWLLFAMVMLESTGLPIPGETALIAAALYAGSAHAFSLQSVILIAALAAMTGDNLGYVIGRTFGHRLLARYGKYIRLSSERLRIGEYLFFRHGGKIVFFGRFVAFLRTFAAILAGANRMPWQHFLLMNGLGATLWAALFGSGAYLFGNQIHRITGPFSVLLLIGAAVAVMIGGWFLHRHEQELQRRADVALTERDKRLAMRQSID